MKIVKVSDKRTVREFLDVVDLVYKNDKVYVRPLDAQIEAIFDPAVNKFFQHGSAERFILVDDNGKTIGRVAAFINERKAYGFDQPTGGMGFFECINNKDAAYLLFETAKTWLAEKGMQAMDGPINFGENDSFWGLLTEDIPTRPLECHTIRRIIKSFSNPMVLLFTLNRLPSTLM